jgi:hypothetical protein
MILVMVVSVLGAILFAIILGIALFNQFCDGGDEKYTIAVFGFLEAVCIFLITVIGAVWNDPVKVTVIDKDGQTLIYNVQRHEFDSNSSSDCVQFNIDQTYITHCNIKSYTMEYLNE